MKKKISCKMQSIPRCLLRRKLKFERKYQQKISSNLCLLLLKLNVLETIYETLILLRIECLSSRTTGQDINRTGILYVLYLYIYTVSFGKQ